MKKGTPSPRPASKAGVLREASPTAPPRGRGSAAPSIVQAQPKAGVKFSELSEKQKAAFGTPGGFGRLVLKIPLTPKQEAICNAFMPNRAHVSVLCCNEAGKTTKILPSVILWHLVAFPRRGENGGVTATSGSWAQVTNQLMPALQGKAHLVPRLEFGATTIKRDGIPNFMAYSTNNAGLAEGFHGSADNPLMMLFDECKSVKDGIIRAGEDRCRPQRMGLLSSPGFAMGKFYASHTTEAAYWDRHQMTVKDCPWIDPVEMQRVITRAGGGDYEKGLNDAFIRSAYFAEFMPFVQNSLISLADIEECLADPPQERAGGRHVRLDFAAGGDENAIGVCIGNRVWIEDAWRDKNPMSAVGRFVTVLNRLRERYNLKPEEVEGDADGLGGPMVARLHETGWPILPYHANGRALDNTKFYNRASEEWFRGCERIKARQVLLCDDADLKGQLVDRQQLFESGGTIKVESKKDLFRRQARDGRPARSPDRAEVVLGALAPLQAGGSFNVAGAATDAGPWRRKDELPGSRELDEVEIDEEVLRGFDAGG